MQAESTAQLLRSVDTFKGLDDQRISRLSAQTSMRDLSAGDVLIRQGERSEHLFLLQSGGLDVFIDGRDGQKMKVGQIAAGGVIAEMQVVLGGVSGATVMAGGPCKLACIPRREIEELMDESETFSRLLTDIVLQRIQRNYLAATLRALVGDIDEQVLEAFESRLEWFSVKQGEAVYRHDDPADFWYIVASGRLRGVAPDAEGNPQTFEITHGESVGEMAMLTDERRSGSLYAVRDSTLIRISKGDFQHIAVQYPKVLMAITRSLLLRLTSNRRRASEGHSRIAIVTSSPSLALRDFAERLAKALGELSPTLHLNLDVLHALDIVSHGNSVPDGHPKWIRYSAWLDERAEKNRFIVLEADATLTSWTRRCVRQADHILILADAQDSPAISDLERELFDHQSDDINRARRTLILVHPNGNQVPSGTLAWLTPRKLDAHRHVRLDNAGDFGRVARLLAGRAVGLTLGGGGARGYAHIGVIKAMRELGIPIDMVGGTSMGGIISGQCGLDLDIDRMMQLNKEIIATNPFGDYTVPLMAMLASKRVDDAGLHAFKDHNVEDAWINCFCVSSNLTTAELLIHETGPLARATRASGSLPGVLVPVVMGEHLLVDGGVINNLPADVMRARCSGKVIAVNVSPSEELKVPTDMQLPSSWDIFLSKYVPGRKPINHPKMMDILMRTTMLASNARTKLTIRDADVYLRPPVTRFGMLEFKSFDNIVNAGYEYAMENLKDFSWKS
jgi:NTE family protein/lysophospholipid hydrolase